MKLFPDPFPSSAIAGAQLSWLPSVWLVSLVLLSSWMLCVGPQLGSCDLRWRKSRFSTFASGWLYRVYFVDRAMSHCRTASRLVSSFALMP
jgi:hypothetical protein